VEAVGAQRDSGGRIAAIDALRGLVIVLMALDHCRDFFDADALRFSPTDIDRTYPFLFFTRFITHYCALTFELLAGASAYLHGRRLANRRELAIFLATRGLWLIFLDAVVVSPVWAPGSGKIWLGALWAIGAGMVALSALCWLPARVVLALGASIVAGHNLFDGVTAENLGAWAPLWRLLHERGPLPFGLGGAVGYPVLPWIGVICIGYGMGPLFEAPPERRRRLLVAAGLAALTGFVFLRIVDVYGDPRPWATQADVAKTLMSFLNVSKYPPSLLYLFVTLGPTLLALAALEKADSRRLWFSVLLGFGRAALFAYVLHLWIAVLAALALALASGFTAADIGAFAASRAPPDGFGVGLAGAYVAWALVLLVLYPLCRGFGAAKSRRHSRLLSYF